MAKQISSQFKLQAPGGQATPAPPIGPALGQHGVNPGQFIQQFNERTGDLNGKIVTVEITVYHDRSFEFAVKSPPASVLLKEAAGVSTGSGASGKETAGQVSREQVESIAQQKLNDLNTDSLDAAVRMVEGTARSIGLEVAS
jgi:large subunit ribosomal protein L11